MWSVPGDDEQVLQPRLVMDNNDPNAAVASSIIELPLRRPRSVPFEILGTREVAFDRARNVTLVALPEASHQECSVEIFAAASQGLVFRKRNMEAITPRMLTDTQLLPVRHAFRYLPERDLIAAESATFQISPGVSPGLQTYLWVWQSKLLSRYEANGSALHRAILQIQNEGEANLRIRLPKDSELKGIRRNGKSVTLADTPADDGTLEVPIAISQPFVAIELDYLIEDSPLSWQSSLVAPFPGMDVPVIRSEWNVSVPEGYCLLPEGKSASDLLSWQQRLFGPLGRDIQGKPFDVFSTDSWRELSFRTRLASDLPESVLPANDPAASVSLWKVTNSRGLSDHLSMCNVPHTQKAPPTVRVTHTATIRFFGAAAFLT
ncbi:MAG: hypothetical protein KDA42_17755, partial [Planctomycetales bacterium]|nr:hypothetical protein [Planctomycetales bacterium]